MTRLRSVAPRLMALAAVAAVGVAVVPAALAQGRTTDPVERASSAGVAHARLATDIARVRAATASFHFLPLAAHAGYSRFLDCMDDGVSKGMGQHYVRSALLQDNGALDATQPEALVYDESSGRPRLVAVEYVVPGAPTDPAPHLLGQTFTYQSALGVWKLHFWIWRDNPDGIFKDFSPAVPVCTGSGMTMSAHVH